MICFPYAGGGSWIYSKWQRDLPDRIAVCPVELPGRGSRRHEAPFTDLSALVSTLVGAIRRDLTAPYALFGHSLGARIAIELAVAIRSVRLREPCHIFLSGANPPTSADQDIGHRILQQEHLVDQLVALGGTPAEALADAELMTLSLPVLQADFQLNDTPSRSGIPPLDVPITVLLGQEDPTTCRRVAERWRVYSTGSFRIEAMPGDHFFLDKSRTQVLNLIAAALEPVSLADR